MQKTYPSAIGWIMIVPLALLLGVLLLLLATEPRKWPALMILLPVIVWIIHMLLNTDYTIKEETLKIRCGFFHYEQIDVSTIQSIAETNNPLSSPALSLDRLDIKYGSRRHVMISPKEKEAFIAALLEIHPSIEVRRR